jgi:hypothetical protein
MLVSFEDHGEQALKGQGEVCGYACMMTPEQA